MKTSFESLIEDAVPEINFLTASGSGLKPGHVLESLEKDIVAGYLPDYLKGTSVMKDKSLDLVNEPYDIRVDEIEGTLTRDAAISVMKFLGIKYNSKLKYKIDFDIKEITSTKFKENLDKITFEIALNEFKKENRDSRKIFKRFKGHILVLRVIYATEFEIKVDIDKGNGFEADVNLESVDINGSFNATKKENTLLVSANPDVPFGVIGYKIKGNKLKEVD
ncbi:MAG: hypothetical protein AAGF85_03920 [Bacteroidota bacterium]